MTNRRRRPVTAAVMLCLAGCAAPAARSTVVPQPATGASAGRAAPDFPAARRALPDQFLLPLDAAVQQAVARGTRSATGEPGARYWQQRARYDLKAELVPQRKRLYGTGTLTYENRSPDTLPALYLHLHMNMFAPEAKRNTQVMSALGGMRVSRVEAAGRALDSTATGPGWSVEGTVLELRLPAPLAPGASTTLALAWDYRIPPDGAPRGGQDTEVYVLSYWYPQFAVYDDVNGWQTDPYLGNAEFYMGYGDYTVEYAVPEGWLVASTGTLENAADVLNPAVVARLALARRDTVTVVGDDERGAGEGKATRAGEGGMLRWRFRAPNVRDVTWAASALYRWEAAPAAVGDVTGDGVPDTTVVQAFYRPERRRLHWRDAVRVTRASIETYSRLLWAYPYPHMTAVDGPASCGGMEYPMFTCIGIGGAPRDFAETVAHEVAHMWFPMLVGSDEKRFAWQDEGMAQFLQAFVVDSLFPAADGARDNRRFYLRATREGGDAELMRHGDRYPTDYKYGVASYYKPAAILGALRGMLGDSVFFQSLRTYGTDWTNRHPTPWDFFRTVERVAGTDLGWFWRSWYFETWKHDVALGSVTVSGDSAVVEVKNAGKVPMPVRLAVTRRDGSVTRLTLPADVWFSGQNKVLATVDAAGGVTRVEIDPEQFFPDVDRGNQLWPRE